MLGVVLGLAAKDTVANFFAGVFLMADSPFKEGDYIMLETGERGYVKNLGLRSTRFMTRDDIEITIPNSVIAAAKIINESGGSGVEDIERIRISVQVAYGSDVDQVKNILKSIALLMIACWIVQIPECDLESLQSQESKGLNYYFGYLNQKHVAEQWMLSILRSTNNLIKMA